MTPQQKDLYLELVRLLGRPGPLETVLRPVTDQVARMVPLEGTRYDIGDDRGGMWSRVCRPGQEPERPGLGTSLRLKSREEFLREGDQLSFPLNVGGRTFGRWVVKRSGGFTDDDVETLRYCADLFALGLRSRPTDAPKRAIHPFDEPTELL